MISDNGRLVKFKARKDPNMELAIKARSGDIDAAEKLLDIMTKPRVTLS